MQERQLRDNLTHAEYRQTCLRPTQTEKVNKSSPGQLTEREKETKKPHKKYKYFWRPSFSGKTSIIPSGVWEWCDSTAYHNGWLSRERWSTKQTLPCLTAEPAAALPRENVTVKINTAFPVIPVWWEVFSDHVFISVCGGRRNGQWWTLNDL